MLISCNPRFIFPKYFIITFLLTVAATITSNAQILNIERSRVERDTVNFFTGKAGFNFSMFNRNAGKNNPNNFLQLTFNGDLAYISGKHSYLLLNYYNYLLVNYDNKELRNTVASNGYAHFRVNLHRRRQFSYEFFSQLQADKARGLEWRSLTGGGIRVALIRRETSNLYIGSGLMYEYEEWQSPEESAGIVTTDLPKSTNYLSGKANLNSYVSTEGIVYYQTGYDDQINGWRNRVSGETNLLVKLNKVLTFRAGFNCTFEDKPVVPVTRFVYAISNGIQVNF